MLGYVQIAMALLGLVFILPSASAGPSAEQLQQVQSARKNDNLLLSELSQTVQEWTNRCGHMDRTRGDGASECWLNAAAASERFLSLGEPFAQQLRQLQAAWRTRASQIQMTPAASAVTGLQASPKRAELKTPSKTRKAAHLAQTRKKKVVATAKKLVKNSKLAQTQQRKRQALRADKKEVKAVPAAVRQPVEAYPPKGSDRRTIRDQLRRIERKISCTTVKCKSKPRGE